MSTTFAVEAMNAASPLVSAIIVSYNTKQMTLDCLKALYADLGETEAEVFVVDNASSDGSVDAIREHFPDVRLIAADRNLGFGQANNLAMAQARGEFYLLLNSDAFPAGRGTVAGLIDYLKGHPDVGIVGPKLLHRDGTHQPSRFILPSLGHTLIRSRWTAVIARVGKMNRPSSDPNTPSHLEHGTFLAGACIAVRREVVQQIGGFDERFFFYCEEADWEKRVADAGWKLAYFPAVAVTHLGGASGNANRLQLTIGMFEGEEYFIRKHYGLTALLIYRLIQFFGCIARLVRHCILLPLHPRELSGFRFAFRVDFARLAHQFSWTIGPQRRIAQSNRA